ncbi:MAG: FAD-dependent oxidoreductase [Eubacteriales bacterium]|nr:FAD-dependent oxidoreductase [Eubacteriales bacterium]
MDRQVKIAVIGGGPAGLAAALAAREAGVEPQEILILERDDALGGILNQCIHNGFGLHTFKEELTGPEYAARFIQRVKEEEIPCLLHTIVVDISLEKEAPGGKDSAGVEPLPPKKRILAMSGEEGIFTVTADAVILAMGCRERPRGALNIPGYRPAGIYSAGTAQRFVNIEGRMPGHEVVILGSGDIGLIMARRMTLEGAKVKAVAELMPYSGGLKRNIVQCLDDFGIPLRLSHTVVDIRGKERVEAVTIAQVGPDRKPVPGTEETYECDTLLLSCGLLPENELSWLLGVELSPVTNGPVVNESLETNVSGVFACGNVLHVHDLVDYVSEEAKAAGRCAAAYANRRAGDITVPECTGAVSGEGSDTADTRVCSLTTGAGVRYTVPSTLRLSYMEGTQLIRFRVDNVYRDAAIVVEAGGQRLRNLKKRILSPGEMEQVILKRTELEALPQGCEISIRVEQADGSKL